MRQPRVKRSRSAPVRPVSYPGPRCNFCATASVPGGDRQTMAKITLSTLGAWALAAAAWAGPPLPGTADNWPHWRGPEANGTAPHGDPPVAWGEKQNVRWKAELP